MQAENPKPQIQPIEGKPGMFAYDYLPDNPELRAEITAQINEIYEKNKVVEDEISLYNRIINYLKTYFPGI